MKKHLLAVLVVPALLIAASVQAQVTGASVIGILQTQLRASGEYTVDATGGSLLLKDKNGNEVLAIDNAGADALIVHGVIGRIDRLTNEQREKVLQRIAVLNFSLPVGTLHVDANGEVTMAHAMNPRVLTVDRLAYATLMCGSVIRDGARLLAL